MTKTIILIPSRLAATRLPNKPLLKINGISIINHVYEKAKSSKIGEVFVATGDQEIFEEVTKKGGNCILTKNDHQTGTYRIFEAYEKLYLKFYLFQKLLKKQQELPLLFCLSQRNPWFFIIMVV